MEIKSHKNMTRYKYSTCNWIKIALVMIIITNKNVGVSFYFKFSIIKWSQIWKTLATKYP